ncbi:unnamed protein product [Ectocarpus sp. CCAP 1310/34]|nr:unnamed protein product [Ectocarpus sp. CCAP 1310/34]
MEHSNNMNVQAQQNAAASTSAPSTTASTAAAQAPKEITSFFGPAHISSTQEAPTPAPADLTAARAGTATGVNMTASASPQQQPVALLLSAARMNTAPDESTHTSQASQLVVDVVDQEPSTSVGRKNDPIAYFNHTFPGERHTRSASIRSSTGASSGIGASSTIGASSSTGASNAGSGRNAGGQRCCIRRRDVSRRERESGEMGSAAFSLRKIKGAQGPNGTVGITYATRILKVPDKATLAARVKNVAKYEAALAEQDTFKGGGKRKKKARNRLTLNVGRIRTHTAAELEAVDWINELRSDGISVRVSTKKMIKNKAVELNPNFFGERPAPPDLQGSLKYNNRQNLWCRRFLMVYRFSVRAVTRQGQKLPSGWPLVAMQAIKEWRRLEYDVPSALELADGVECLGVVAGAGGSASGSGGGSGAGVLSGPRLKFALAQIGNMDETPTWFESLGKDTVNATGEKEIAVKAGGKEKMRITSVQTVFAERSKLPPLLIFKGQPTPKGKSPAADSIERDFRNYKDRKGCAYPRGMAYVVDPKGWHSQRVFDDVWVPQVWNRRPGRQGRLGGYRQPGTLLAWDDYIVHKTDASTKAMEESNTTLFPIPGGLTPKLQPCDGLAMEESNTTLFPIPGGLTPKLQPCDGLVNKIFKANMSRLYDDHMASKDVTRDDRGYPKPPSRGLVAQWVKKARDALTADEIRSSWRKAGLLLPFDGSEDEAWANKELGVNAKGEPIGAPSDAADKADSSSGGENLLEVLDIDDDDDTGGVVVDVSDDEGEEL